MAFDQDNDDFEDIDDQAVADEAGEDLEPSIEDRARAMGWHPLAEYHGPPGRWVTAEDFVAKAERETPVMRANLRRMSEQIPRMQTEMATMRETMASQAKAVTDAMELARRAGDAGYQRALRELKQEQLDAVAAGDVDGFKDVEGKIDALTEEYKPAAAAAPPPAAPAAPPQTTAHVAVDPAVAEFATANAAWWNKDAQLSQAMIAIHTMVIADNPEMPLAEQLQEALGQLKARYPQKFPDDAPAGGDDDFEDEDNPPMPARKPAAAAPPRRAAPMAPRGAPPARGGGSVWDKITDAGERAGAQAAYKNAKRHQPDLTAAEYVALYIDPHADVLDIQRRSRDRAQQK